MKKRNISLLFVMCLFCLSACQAQADVQPAPTTAPASANQDAEAYEEAQEEWAEGMQDLQEELADARQDVREALKEQQKMQTRLRSSGVDLNIPGLYELNSQIRVGMDPVRAGSVLFVPEKPMNNETVDRLAEDMQVMSMILEETTNPPQNPDRQIMFGGTLPRMFFGSHFRPAPKATWIENYGIVFLLEVEYPVIEINVSDTQQPAVTDDNEDQVWKRNRNKLKGLEQPDTKEEKVVIFDPDKAAQLREKLIGALKHATNIRNLSSDDRIVVMVRSIINGDIPGRMTGVDTKASVPVPTSVMTIQATKKDIDAFAAGKIDQDGFAQKVSVVIY